MRPASPARTHTMQDPQFEKKLLERASLSWHEVLDALPQAIAFINSDGVIRHVNDHLALVLRLSSEELIGRTFESLVRETQQEELRHRLDGLTNTDRGGLDLRTCSLLRKGRADLAVRLSLSDIDVLGQKWRIVVIYDQGALDDAEHRRDEFDDRYQLAFDDNMAPMLFTDHDDHIIAVNGAFCEMVGYSQDELLGRTTLFFTFPEDIGITEEAHRRATSGEADRVRYNKRYLRKDGRMISVEVAKSTVRNSDGDAVYFIVSERDVTEERKLTEELSHQALHDPLTGLANRVLFDDRLSQAHARVLRQNSLGAVLLLDLDDFKGVNNTHQHHVGDQLLAAVSRRLEQVTGSLDSLCRSGDDEFLCLAEGLGTPEEAELLAARLLDVLAEPFSFAGEQIEQNASIGVAVWDSTSESYSEIVQQADVALYQAKLQGKGRYVVFTPGMHQHAVTRFSLTQELRQALHNGDLAMHYQPVIDFTTNQVVGFEALMRWQHPERGWVPPDVFIPLAEQSDLILELGTFALRDATRAVNAWSGEAGSPYVTVNCSARQFHDSNLIATIEEVLLDSELSPESLVIEITESVALSDVTKTLSMMERLRTLGVRIALDDFGTGFSSLSYLTLLQPNFIKIDRSFVSPPRESAHNDTLLETVVSLGHKLSMTVVAEGVETPVQFARLRELSCDLGQGYLFSPAIPQDEATALVRHAVGA